MRLYLTGIVRVEYNVRSNIDQRYRVDRYIVNYRDTEGNDYRKSFESRKTPNIPETGTHKTLNALQRQWVG
jgi:hypothetical protein